LGRTEGAALWPQRWPLNELQIIRHGVGARAFAARFQGDPRADEGNILDSRKLPLIEACDVPPLMKIVRRWDLAFSERQGADYLAGAKIGITFDGKVFILHVDRVNGRWTKGKAQIVRTAKADGVGVTVAIESNGTQLGYYQDIKDHPEMLGHVVLSDCPVGTKEMRASVWGTRLEDGIIKCVRGPWNGMLIDEMDSFGPGCEHDDVVDAVSGAYALCVSGVRNAVTMGYSRPEFDADRLTASDF
jgi:predicted phage terminase large subunit-like protein